MSYKVAINGFGRIGRLFLRTATQSPQIDIVAINDIADAKTLAHLLKYDSIFGTLAEDVSHGDGFISVAGKRIKVSAVKDPAMLPWKELSVDLVVESTGLFTKRPEAEKHLQAGAKKVLISAPATDPDVTIVLGVNDGSTIPRSTISSPTPPAPPTVSRPWLRSCTMNSRSSKAT